MDNTYARAYTEVLEIISHFPKEEYNKIPNEKIQFYRNNMDKDYKYKINPYIDLTEQPISRETNAILVILFRDYFADENQKETLKQILDLNQAKLEKEKSEKYNSEEIFKSAKQKWSYETTPNNEANALVEYKEPFFVKFKKFIFKLLHIN